MDPKRGKCKSVLAMTAGAVLLAMGAGIPDSVQANGTSLAQAEKSEKSKSRGKSRQQAQTARQGGEVPVLVLIPITQNVDTLGDGCWARFYDDENFEGDQLTLVGPVDLPNMKFHQRFYWGGLDSVVVGPKATVTIYDDENYRDRNATIQPGEHVRNLDDQKLGLFEDIESIRITCPQSR